MCILTEEVHILKTDAQVNYDHERREIPNRVQIVQHDDKGDVLGPSTMYDEHGKPEERTNQPQQEFVIQNVTNITIGM
ncbi:unnamed protein product [Cylicostephanus goldi]|uniref:Uncharacterized protein n=1 Tax=Cylicostephanus goldi TaxID=71465 RepID=A0A3P7NXR3_CYLGO|nr:unnamed protein product [Cylicostephanus goldi]